MNRVTLDNIVRGYLINTGKNTLHGYLRIMKFLVDFLKKFSLNHVFMDHNTTLTMDQKFSVPLPDGFITWTKIGWKNGDRIEAFENDSTIAIQHSRSEDGISGTPNDPYKVPRTNAFTEYLYSNAISIPGDPEGNGNNKNGYFRINYDCNEIQFNSNVITGKQVYLEYKSNGFNAKSTSTLPEFAVKLAEDYINWQMARYKFGEASVETEARKRAFWDEQDEVVKQTQHISYEAIVGTKARASQLNRLAM